MSRQAYNGECPPPRFERATTDINMEWYIGVLKKYVEFSGRARRKEYWMFTLFNLIIALVLGFVDSSGVVGVIYALAVFLPSIAVSIRRLHDTGRSGWWMLLLLLPLIGAIVLLVFMIFEGNAGQNEYGADPKAVDA